MVRLIRFELINIFKGISFYVCLACIFVMSITSVFVRALADVVLYGMPLNQLGTLGYSGIKFLIETPASSDYPVLIGILATIAVCSGYSDKSYRNLWSRGISRTQVYIGKCAAVSVAAIVYGFTSMLAGFVIGTILWGCGEMCDNLLITIIVEMLVCIGIGMLYIALSFIFKKMGIAIVIAVMTPSLFSIGSVAIDYILDYKEIYFRVSPFILTNVLSEIALAPGDAEVLAKAFLCFAIYFVTMNVLGIMGMRKDEI